MISCAAAVTSLTGIPGTVLLLSVVCIISGHLARGTDTTTANNVGFPLSCTLHYTPFYNDSPNVLAIAPWWTVRILQVGHK